MITSRRCNGRCNGKWWTEVNMINLSTVIYLEEQRCHDCGTWWATEKFNGRCMCPRCAGSRLGKLIDEVNRLERTNRSLRGVLTRWKRH